MAERVYIALDLETTGLDAKRDSIIEIGAVRFQGNHILDRFVTLVNPHRTIPLRVQQITNIRNSDVADAPSLDVVIPQLLAFVRNDVRALIAHNAAFDIGFLQAAGIYLHSPVLDTFELATMLLPKAGSYSLGELCQMFGIPLTDAHRALDDAEATAQLFMRLQQQVDSIATQTLRSIVESVAESEWSPVLLFGDVLAQRQPDAESVVSQSSIVAHTTHTTTNGNIEAEVATSPSDGLITLTAIPAPLVETAGRQQPVASQLVDDFFANGGPLGLRLGELFEIRRGQIDMAQQVLRAFNEGDHLLLEAGTGIGKSLAYLTPAALWSITNARRVVIATNTITLQEQLLEKEVPLLQEILAQAGEGVPRVALLKGRHHYLCIRRFHHWRKTHSLSPVELTFLVKILLWLPTTQRGDMAELFLATAAERSLWQQVCSDPATCSPELCGVPLIPPPNVDTQSTAEPNPLSGDFFYLAQQRADNAHLLVVNHALLIADLVAGGRLLPAYSHLIVDEAHRLDEVATEQLTYRADWQWILLLLRRITIKGDLLVQIERVATSRGQVEVVRLLYELADEVEQLLPQLDDFKERLLNFVLHQKNIRADATYDQQIHLDGARRTQPQWSQIEMEWEQIQGWLSNVTRRQSTLLNQLDGLQWRESADSATLYATLRESYDRLRELSVQLQAIIFQGNNVDHNNVITWAELTKRGKSVSLLAAPLYVNEILETDLILQQRTAIFTGATLRTGSGFTFLRDRLGLWHATTFTVESPFDYEWSTLLCMPDDLSTPDHPYYQAAVERAIVDVAIATGGKTLALFTSYAQLRTTADAIRTELDRVGITVLEHGTNSRRRILREYRQLEQAVLLGTRSFWEGVDLPGDELQSLLIVKLPFAVPTDPLVAARCQDLENPFGEYMLPDAILRFRQGFGRLIRRERDQGVVVLLDSRLWRKEYGRAFLESLPRCTTSRAPLSNLREEIQDWLLDHV